MTEMPVMAFDPDRTTNAQLMVDCLRLGYLPSDGEMVLDATYGLGSFWKHFGCGYSGFRNRGVRWFDLKDNDLFTESKYSHDYTKPMPWDDRFFHTVVFDPPYKLNGTPTPSVDTRYGVGESATMESRLDSIRDGVHNLAHLADQFFLIKVQDQVSGGKVRWMTEMVANYMKSKEWFQRDELYVSSYRPQPSGRTQKHARRNYSTLMVFERTT